MSDDLSGDMLAPSWPNLVVIGINLPVAIFSIYQAINIKFSLKTVYIVKDSIDGLVVFNPSLYFIVIPCAVRAAAAGIKLMGVPQPKPLQGMFTPRFSGLKVCGCSPARILTKFSRYVNPKRI